MVKEDTMILTTWKQIGWACGGRSIKTIKKLAKKYHMPYSVINGRPEISRFLLLEWHRKICEIDQKRREKNGWVDPNERGEIYFIQVGEDGPIKIGFATDTKKRMKDLQASSPTELRILGKFKGSMRDEKKTHEKFKKFWLRNEWFECNPQLIEFIKKCKIS